MKPTQRSRLGLVIAILGLPVVMGLVACLPVPIGNPEKSRIDPELSGTWIMDGETIVLMEPYDKRTWLMSHVNIKHYPDDCSVVEEPAAPVEQPADKTEDQEDLIQEVVIPDDDRPDDEYGQLVADLEADTAGCYGAENVALFKVWRSEFGKRPFITWEPMGVFADPRAYKSIWYGFRVDRADADNFYLWMIDLDSSRFEGIEALDMLMDSEPPHSPRVMKSVQRAIEKVLRRNADNDDIYSSHSTHLRRVDPDDVHVFMDLVEEVVSVDQ